MCKYSVASYFVLLYLLCVTHGYNRRQNNRRLFPRESTNFQEKRQTSNEFDVLIFTQQWPLTACFVWKKNSDTRSCLLPKHEEWTIHGIWPSKFHTTSPQFCNKSLEFNSSALAPIENVLKERWFDIHKGSKPYSFWKHEWDKHGTCAVTVKALNNEFNYFQGALKLFEKYNMTGVLTKASILPGNKYMVQDMITRIQNILNKTVQITCVADEETRESYVSEIRICFNKTLQLVDCNGIFRFPTDCDRSKEILYPSHVPRYYVTQI